MIFSAEDLFSDGQVLTATGGSTNYYDLGAHGTPLGGNALDYHNFTSIPIWVSNDVAATGTGPTCTVTVESDDDSAFGSTTAVSPAYTLGTAAGDVLALQILPENINERYFRLLFTLGGVGPSFTITAGVVGEIGRASCRERV